jgi:superoxide dismutase, Cu-Zn family
MSQIKRLLLLPLTLLVTCLVAGPLSAQSQQVSTTFVNADGKPIGTAMLKQTPSGVLIDINVSGLPPGAHALHIHETGKCDVPDFKSAGDHYNPTGAKHGFVAGREHHAGDMPNQFVQGNGVLQAQVLNPQVTLYTGKATLFDADGSALIIHAGADDYASQPAGEAGNRLACAMIRPG